MFSTGGREGLIYGDASVEENVYKYNTIRDMDIVMMHNKLKPASTIRHCFECSNQNQKKDQPRRTNPPPCRTTRAFLLTVDIIQALELIVWWNQYQYLFYLCSAALVP